MCLACCAPSRRIVGAVRPHAHNQFPPAPLLQPIDLVKGYRHRWSVKFEVYLNSIYSPKYKKETQELVQGFYVSALGATRTHDPLVRNQVLYPLSYEGKGGEGGIRTHGRVIPDNHLAGGPNQPLWHLPMKMPSTEDIRNRIVKNLNY